MTFSEQRQSRYRIVIDNQDNPPLEIDAVSGIGHGYQLLFLPQAGNHYRLQYGVDKAAAPHYDTAAIRELLHLGYAGTAAALGPATAVAPVTDKPDISRLLDNRLLLGIAITLMVVVLAWSLYRLVLSHYRKVQMEFYNGIPRVWITRQPVDGARSTPYKQGTTWMVTNFYDIVPSFYVVSRRL